MIPFPAPALVALQLAASGGPSFPELAARELAALRPGVTAAAWLAVHPSDGFTSFRRDSIRESHDRWCGRASSVVTPASGALIERYAHFYPPLPPPSLALPATGGPTLIREQCLLGTVWLETGVDDSASGSALATTVREALTRAHGPVAAGPNVFFGPLPADSQRRLLSRLPGADAMLLGLHFFGAAAWRTPGRWQVDSTVTVSAFDRGLGGGRTGGRVLAFAFLPIAELGSFDWVEQRARARERHTSALAAEAARLSELDPSKTERLLAMLAAAESGYTGRHKVNPAALDSTAVAVLREWITSARGLPPPRRAAALLAADQVLGSSALNYVRAQRDDSLTRRALERLGAAFARNELGGGYNYVHTWLDDALRLDPQGRAGTLATMALLRSGFNRTGMCGGGSEAFRQVIATGERLLATTRDPATAGELHRLVGDAYADIVALASGAGMEYVDTAQYAAEAPAARRSAIAHYRQALTLDRTMPESRAAWLEAWRLLAGLPPTTTYFFCVYD